MSALLPRISALLRRIFSRKTFVRLVFGAAAIMTLLVVVIAVEDWRGSRAWDAYRTAAEKNGTRLQLVDFLAPEVPDAENFAAIPVLQEIFAASAAGKEMRNPLAWPKGWKEPEPKMANRLAGEHTDLARWSKSLATAQLLPQLSDNAAADTLAALAYYEPILQQFREAAQRPHARFPVKWELNISAPIPHIHPIRSAAQIEALRMKAHLALGDSAAAYADWRDILALYHALEHEPVLIMGLIRISILNTLVDTGVWEGLAGRTWAEPELRAIGADLAGLNLVADLHFAMASERGGMNATIDWVRTLTQRERWQMMNGMAGPESSSSGSYLGAWFYPRGWYLQSQVKVNELYDHRLAEIDVAQGRLKPDASGDEELAGLKGAGFLTRSRYMLAALLMPSLTTIEKKYALTDTTVQQARVACALELFRRAHGAFPERLEELVPGTLDAIPHDVMDGSPLHYRRTAEGGFELWGVGWNRHDDGGKSGPSKNPSEQPDWVWRS